MSRRPEEGRPGERGLNRPPRACELSCPWGCRHARQQAGGSVLGGREVFLVETGAEEMWERTRLGLRGRLQQALGACVTHRRFSAAERTA